MPTTPLQALSLVTPPHLWDPTEWVEEDHVQEPAFVFLRRERDGARISVQRYEVDGQSYYVVVHEL
jgi:hypothetical protein